MRESGIFPPLGLEEVPKIWKCSLKALRVPEKKPLEFLNIFFNQPREHSSIIMLFRLYEPGVKSPPPMNHLIRLGAEMLSLCDTSGDVRMVY